MFIRIATLFVCLLGLAAVLCSYTTLNTATFDFVTHMTMTVVAITCISILMLLVAIPHSAGAGARSQK